MVKSLTVYKASAGSGKTFTLAVEYISLVVQNPLSFRSILAVTFTNKATEEMKMRILSQLYGIWQQLPSSDTYLQEVRKRTGLGEALIRQRAGQTLQLLIQHYPQFRVMTIDTFFQSVLRNLARELDLTATLHIGLNDVQVEEMAVDEMISALTTRDVMLQWLMRYILESISDDKSWNVIGQIKKFGRTIFKDEYKAVSARLREKMEEPGFFDQYTRQLRAIRQQALKAMQGYAEPFFEAIGREGLTADDFAYKEGGVYGFFRKLRDGIFDESIAGVRVSNCIDDPSKWCSKKHPRKDAIAALVDSTLNRLLKDACEERPRQWCLYKSADLTLRHLSQLRLLGSIEQRVRRLNEESNRFLLSDTQQLLHALIDGSDSPFIFEKIGAQLEQVMIDEFQDTSTVQWQNFKVLLTETMSRKQAGNLIVGDVKQSIYRWRSGDWRLLNDIEGQFSNPAELIEVKPLATNFRSASRVIRFNNAFFTRAAEAQYEALKDIPGAEQLRKAYADVEQQIPEGHPDEGNVWITLLPGEDYQQATFRLLADHIATLLKAGVAAQDIAVLVRTNAPIPLIAQYLVEHLQGVSVVSDEAFRLDASIAVNILILALTVITRPDDLLSRAALIKLYQRQVMGNSQPDEALLINHDTYDDLLPEAFAAHTDALRQMPLYELTERLYAIFQLERLNGQSAYVCAFFDRMADFLSDTLSLAMAGHRRSLAALFLREWEDNLSAKTIQSDEMRGIRLISIHKSKGLEFPHVIIPFCDWPIEKNGEILWCQPSSEPFSQLPLAPIDFSSSQLIGTIYENDYNQEHLRNIVDNLNLLYVAFTRAERSLFVIGKRDTKATSRSCLIEETIAGLKDALPGSLLNAPDDKAQPVIFEYYREGAPLCPAKTKKAKPAKPNPFLTAYTPLPVSIATYDATVEFRQSNRSKSFIEGDEERNSYIQTGSILHEVFSTIRTSADITPALKRLQMEGIIYDEQNTAERLVAMLHKRLEHPRVADWFSGRYRLYNECTILFNEDGQLKERRPDRVMTDGTRWIVVDFKFGTPKAGYQDQVREYMRLIKAMHPAADITGYLWYIYSNKVEPVAL